MNTMIGTDLALMLKNSQESEVASLANEYLELEAAYKALRHEIMEYKARRLVLMALEGEKTSE